MIQSVEQSIIHPSFEKNGSETATITCAACGAAYVPSQAHPHLREAPPAVLEAALTSMCHFCFRCRKAACPACWDTVHGICGTCVEEVHLTFRVEAAPVKGLMFPPARFDQGEQDDREEKYTVPPIPPLVCVQPGRFQRDISVSTDPLKSVAVPPPTASLPVETVVAQEQAPTLHPAGLQTRGEAQPHTRGEAQPPPRAEASAAPTVDQPHLRARIFRVVERVVTVALLVVLVAVVVLIVLAEVSAGANVQILRFLHVDIRHEIAYLFSLIQQLHW
jgi:hypothetical protein